MQDFSHHLYTKNSHIYISVMKLKDTCFLGEKKKTMTNLDSVIKTETLLCRQNYGFSGSHIWMWKLDNKKGWAPKNWCLWTMVLEKTPESPMDSKESNPVNPERNQPWIFIGRTDAEAPIFWPPNAKSWLVGKDSDWCWKRLKAKGEEGDRGWDGWMASLTEWT